MYSGVRHQGFNVLWTSVSGPLYNAARKTVLAAARHARDAAGTWTVLHLSSSLSSAFTAKLSGTTVAAGNCCSAGAVCCSAGAVTEVLTGTGALPRFSAARKRRQPADWSGPRKGSVFRYASTAAAHVKSMKSTTGVATCRIAAAAAMPADSMKSTTGAATPCSVVVGGRRGARLTRRCDRSCEAANGIDCRK